MEAVFVQDGDQIDYTAKVNVAVGEVVVENELIGVTREPLVADQVGSLAVEGVFEVQKEAGVGEAFGFGDLVYWNDTTKFAVTTDGGGSNKLLGKAVLSSQDEMTSVRVRIG